MKAATLDQAAKILALFKDTPSEQVQQLLASGLLADLRDGNLDRVGRDALRRLVGLAPLASDKMFEVWRTLIVGGKSKEELLREFERTENNVSDWARDIMGKPAFRTSTESREVSFVRTEVRDLGFTKTPTTVELFDQERLGRFNLDLCKPEDGPYLRIAFPDQPKNDWFWVAMEPITDSDGDLRVWDVGRSGGGRRWLGAGSATPGLRWTLGSQFVFRLRK